MFTFTHTRPFTIHFSAGRLIPHLFMIQWTLGHTVALYRNFPYFGFDASQLVVDRGSRYGVINSHSLRLER